MPRTQAMDFNSTENEIYRSYERTRRVLGFSVISSYRQRRSSSRSLVEASISVKRMGRRSSINVEYSKSPLQRNFAVLQKRSLTLGLLNKWVSFSMIY